MNNDFYIDDLGLSENDLKKYLNHYISLNWEQEIYNFGGKTIIPRRKTYMMGKDYSYSGQTKKSHNFDDTTLIIKSKIEEKLNLYKNYFNGCLLNLYEDGDASISYHKDDESSMPENSMIVSFSLGSTRKFFLKKDKDNEGKRITEKLSIKNGEILIMKNECQKKWSHSIPKEKDIIEPRISLTFRRFKD